MKIKVKIPVLPRGSVKSKATMIPWKRIKEAEKMDILTYSGLF